MLTSSLIRLMKNPKIAARLSPLKTVIAGLRQGKAYDDIRLEPTDFYKRGLLELNPGQRRATKKIVEKAGFDPERPMYHAGDAFITNLKPGKGDLGVHITEEPMTALARGYHHNFRYTTGRQGYSPDQIARARGLPYMGGDSMRDLLDYYHRQGAAAPVGRRISKYLKHYPQPGPGKGNWAELEFRNMRRHSAPQTIDPGQLPQDFNIYPLFVKKGLKTLRMPDPTYWNEPVEVIKMLRETGTVRGPTNTFQFGYRPELAGMDFSDAKRFYGKYEKVFKKILDENDQLFGLRSAGMDAMQRSRRLEAWNKKARAKLLKLFKKEGYEGIEYPNFIEGQGANSYLIFDPGKFLRSTHAKYKTRAGEKGILMSSLLPLISLLRGQREE
mgnify:CR=1 FL=1